MIERLNLPGLVEHLVRTGRYPALVFLFSRAGVEDTAAKLAERVMLLGQEEAAAVEEEVARAPEGVRKLHPGLCRCLPRGVGYHHAGLLPSAKRLVEGLFARGYVPLLFCTETFALGVNYPARTVVLGSCAKRGDDGYRPLLAREVLQMAGRAGRRGMDRRGFVYVAVDPDWPEDVLEAVPAGPEPLSPDLVLTPATVLRLHARFASSPELARRYLESGFAAFRARKRVAELRKEEERRKVELVQMLKEHGCCLPEPPSLVRDEAAAGECPRKLRDNLVTARQHVERTRADLRSDEKALETAKKPHVRQRIARGIEGRRRELSQAEERLAGLEKLSPHPCRWAGEIAQGGRCPVEKQVRGAALALYRVREELRAADLGALAWQLYCNLKAVLEEAEFATPVGLTAKGRLCVAVGDPAGLLFAESLSRDVPEEPAWLAGLAAGCLCEGDEEAATPIPGTLRPAHDFLVECLEEVAPEWTVRYSLVWHKAVARWTQGADIEEMARIMPPGDFVVLARRAAEVLRAAGGAWPPLRKQLLEAYRAVWRGEVAEVLGVEGGGSELR